MTRTNKPSSLLLIAAMLIGANGASLLFADQVVYFVNGKAMTVKKVEKGDRITILEIEGGGRIGVPTPQIDRIDELEVSQPAPAVAIPAPTAGLTPGAVPPAAAPAVTSSNPAVAAAPPPGPTIGAKQAGAGNNLNGPQALAIGADDGEAALPAPNPQKVTVPSATQGAAMRPPASRFDGAMARPNAGRRFNGRGVGGPGQGRPSTGMYYPPRPAAGQPAAGAGAPPAAGAAPAAPAPAPAAGNSQPVEPPAVDPSEPPSSEVEPDPAFPEEPAQEQPGDPGDASSEGN